MRDFVIHNIEKNCSSVTTLDYTFDWKTRTLTWFAERVDMPLSPMAAIRRLASNLENRGARVEISPQQDFLTFRASWRSQRSWIGGLREGKVTVTVRDGRLVAVVSGSVAWRVLLPPFYLSIFPFFFAWPLGLLAFILFTFFIVGTYYLVARSALRAVAKAALSLD